MRCMYRLAARSLSKDRFAISALLYVKGGNGRPFAIQVFHRNLPCATLAFAAEGAEAK